MITQIEIDGFKTFKDFKVELAPFQVIVGPNGSGKSNLFDALQLLARLASMDILQAFQGMRESADELFTRLANGKHVEQMSFAIELLLDRRVQDDLGREIELKFTRLRYELKINRGVDEHGLDRLYMTHESLKAIPRDADRWSRKYLASLRKKWIPETRDDDIEFITADYPTAHVFLENQRGEILLDGEISFGFERMPSPSTMLNQMRGPAWPSISAVRKEMCSWQLLHLNPETLRRSSATTAPRFLAPDGRYLPTMLARMQAEDEFALTDVSRDMANLVPEIFKVKVNKNELRSEYDIQVVATDDQSFSAQVLSDGTLRLLALAAVRNDPHWHGVLCIEEPDDGVHPLSLKNMTYILRAMATDLRDHQQVDEPLRQVLVTTHSPLFISQPDAINSLLLTIMPAQVREEGSFLPSKVTRMIPVVTSNTRSRSEAMINGDKAVEAYTIDTVRQYLSIDDLDKASGRLKKARTALTRME